MTAAVAAARRSDPWGPTAWARRQVIPKRVTVGGRPVGGSTVKAVLCAMATYASPNGTNVRPGTERLAGDTQRDERTVRAAVRYLESVGLVVQTRASTQGRAAEYRLVMHPISADEPRLSPVDNPGENPDLTGHGARPDEPIWAGMVPDLTGHGAPPSLPTEDRTPPTAAIAAPPPLRSLADFPDDLAPLRAALHRAHIRPTWNLTAGQADQVRRDLDRCGERVLVAAAYAASTGRAPLAWWSGLLSTFAGALPAPAPDSTGAHSPVDGDAGATPAPASPAQRAQHADELRKSLGWAPRPRPDRKDAQP